MKKMFLIILVLLPFLGKSQDQSTTAPGFKPSAYYTFFWNTAIPIGDFNKWVNSASPAGGSFEGRYIFANNIAAGFGIGWQRVTQSYDYETFYTDNGQAITATNYRFTWMVPFQATVSYHFIPDKFISPYVGLGIGGDYMEHHLLIQEYDIYKTRWDFSLTPEVGALIKFGYYSGWGAVVAFNYKWTTNEIDLYNDRISSDLQMLNLRIGLSYILR